MIASTALKISLIGVGVGTLTFIYMKYRNSRRQSSKPNKQWRRIGTLKEIALYPVKSSSAIVLEEADCNKFGLCKFGFRDRSLVLITESDGRFASLGRYPLMLSIHFKVISNGCLQVTAPNMEPLTVDLDDIMAHGRQNVVKQEKGYRLELIECESEQHIWLSRVILQQDHGMRLYICSDPILETSWWRSSKIDWNPIMVMHDKSVEELNLKLEKPNKVHHQQFRGNLLIESLEDVAPFDEDNWLWLKIGDDPVTATILRYTAPCLRCIIPNIDVFTCERNKNFEPLRTLQKCRIRAHPKEPEMGIYFDVFQSGALKNGDPVYVQFEKLNN